MEDEIIFLRNFIRRNGGIVFSPEECYSEGYSDNGYFRALAIAFILTEKRRNKKELFDVKVCTCCKLPKTANEYYLRTDYRMGFTYHQQPCRQCRKIEYLRKVCEFIRKDDLGIHFKINGIHRKFATSEFYGGEFVYAVNFPNENYLSGFSRSKRAKNFYMKYMEVIDTHLEK